MQTKRFLDLTITAAAVICLLPFFPLLALAVRWRSPGPIFYKQQRVGIHGKPFTMWKFRTMHVNADAQRKDLCACGEQLFKLKHDPRVTPIGKFLRRASLDELPQLLNVLRGDMSLVGPRPPLPDEVAAYTKRQARRLDVLPGLTGLWQVSGRSDLPLDKAVALDLYYVKKHNIWLDLKILAKTVEAVVSGRGAY